MKRAYSSELRRGHSEDTRRRILEAVARVVANGISGLSVPAVAREAGVSVPTVYRYFRSKDELIEGMGLYYSERIGAPMSWPRDFDDLLASITETFERAEQLEPALKAAMLTDAGRAARMAILPMRYRVIEKAAAEWLDRLPPRDRELAKRICVALASSGTLRTFKDYLGLEAKDAAEAAQWAIRRILGIEEKPHGRRAKR